MNGRKYDDRLLLAAARLSHRSGKNLSLSLSPPFHFPSFPPGFTYIIVVVIIPVNTEGD